MDAVAWSKPVVVLAGAWPALNLGWGLVAAFVFGAPLDLGPNPAQTIEHTTGDWCLNFLLLTLTISPLRRLTGWNKLIRYRRMLGLFAFFYGLLHVCAYIAFDQVFRFDAILADIAKRPFITVGMAALVLMVPLAITSTRGWIRRLGGKNWNLLHRLVYATAILGVVHYWWLVKRDITWPMIYGAILVLLLGARLVMAFHSHRKNTLRA